MATIVFIDNEVSANIRNKAILKKSITSLFKKEQTALESLTYVFCSDKFLKKLNKRFLNHNFYTDVLTFTISGADEPLMAEIYISVERILENSKKYKQPYRSELLRVMIHGALHLCGYDDDGLRNQKVMRMKEDDYLRLWRST